jgi:tetratricopeptide (TPR) repeat protein
VGLAALIAVALVQQRSNRALRASNLDLIKANSREQEARELAQTRYALARRVVDEMYTGVAEKLDNEKQMDDYQREILEKALVFYEQFALPQSRDPLVRLEAARAGMRVGEIRSRLGNVVGAEQADRQAVEVLSGLVSDHPDVLEYRDAMAQAHQNLGVVFRFEERWFDCERQLKEAASIWDALTGEKPEVDEFLSKRANAHGELAWLYFRQMRNRIEEAEAEFRVALDAAEQVAQQTPAVSTYQVSLASILSEYSFLRHYRNDDRGSEAAGVRAVTILEKLTHAHPDVPKYQVALGNAVQDLGHRFAIQKRYVEAEATLKRSIALVEKLAADHPRDVNIANLLHVGYHNMAEAFLLQGDARSALEWIGRAIPILRSLARQDPQNRLVGRSSLRVSLADRAEILIRLGRHADALSDYDEILELSHGLKTAELFAAFQALTKARLGDLSALTRMGDQVRDTVKAGAGLQGLKTYPGWMLYYDAACIHAALAQGALRDQGKPLAERQGRADRDIELALDLLENARSTNEIKENIRLDEVRRETLLDVLRANRRFQLLMMDLEFPANPFEPKG